MSLADGSIVALEALVRWEDPRRGLVLPSDFLALAEESSLIVLKAFQYSKAPDHRYLIINCFEAALAIYFLDPEIVKGIWKVAEGAGWQGSYSVTAVAAASWKDHWIPEELRERLSFDPATKRLVLRGVLTERQKEVLLAALPDHERDFETVIHELFKKSRLLPEETTL